MTGFPNISGILFPKRNYLGVGVFYSNPASRNNFSISFASVEMDSLTIDFVSTQRGHKMLVCLAFLFLFKGADAIIWYELNHNHEAYMQKLSRQVISHSCKRKAMRKLLIWK